MENNNLYSENRTPSIGEEVLVVSHLLQPDDIRYSPAVYKGLFIISEAGAEIYKRFKPRQVAHFVAVPALDGDKYERDENGNSLIPVEKENIYPSRGMSAKPPSPYLVLGALACAAP